MPIHRRRWRALDGAARRLWRAVESATRWLWRALDGAARQLRHELSWALALALARLEGRDSLLLRRLRRLLHDERDERVVTFLSDREGLEGRLSDPEKAALARTRERFAARQGLYAALLSGSDDDILREAERTEHLGFAGLGLGQRLQIEQARARQAAGRALRNAVDAGAPPRAVADAWWRATVLGFDVEGRLAVAAQQARHALAYASLPPFPQPPSSPEPATPPRPTPERTRRRRADQAQAIAALAEACRRDDGSAIMNAARRLRLVGALAPDIDWGTVYAAEHCHADQEDLRAALRDGDVGRAARAWSRARSRWSLDVELDAEGRAAFRRWGRMVHLEQRGSPGDASHAP